MYRFPTAQRKPSMELLPEGQANNIQVLWEDQQKINQFSSLINEKDEIIAKLEKLRVEKDYLEDLSLELELLDEDDKIQHKLGDGFVFLTVAEALIKVEEANTKLTGEIEELDANVDDLDHRLRELKAELYNKFGTNINLER